MFEISINHLKNKHIWKHDGSIDEGDDHIGPGGELVITPHTLQAYKKVNLKKMLKDFGFYEAEQLNWNRMAGEMGKRVEALDFWSDETATTTIRSTKSSSTSSTRRT